MYNVISNYYDDIFSVNVEDMKFIKSLLPPNKAIVDIACGTGNKTVLFADIASTVVGIDLDRGMIERAQNYNSLPNISYMTLGMEELAHSFTPASFGSALCLGNSLVHLVSLEKIAQFLHETWKVLEIGGSFVAQILNYDMILERKITTLPALESETARFTREYLWEDSRMYFATTLEVKETGEQYKDRTELFPLQKKILGELLTAAGFCDAAWYGGYDGSVYTVDSFVTIVHCKKA